MGLDLNKYQKLNNFKDYFHKIINSHVEKMIIELNEHHTTYLFSGILRNYFLEHYGKPRDLDIVISRNTEYTNLETILQRYGDFKLNAFGGFKLNIKGLSIDIWHIEDTWAIRNGYVKTDSMLIEKAVLKSTFFNFSSILFDFKKEKFIYDDSFKNFYETKTIDIVLEENLSELLCLINIIYYAENYQLSLSNKVKIYFIKRFFTYSKKDFEDIQINHFKSIKYDYSFLKNFNENLKYNIDF